MAKGATIFKAEVDIADMDREYYAHHSLTLACHPSETEERMMVRLLAFCMFASDHISFGKGLSTQDEPDLYENDLTGAMNLWLDVGQPDERSIRRSCGKARSVVVVGFGGRGVGIWWDQNKEQLDRLENLTILNLPLKSTQALSSIAARNMNLQCNIQDGTISIISGDDLIDVEPAVLHGTWPSRN
ncbi:MAG TPA: YaeQ family protein [Leptospiraceae bacterium]|nr:YaeQ family protein [Leptospiraceae bacterium]HNJ03402.1 YaeQ family protein [Leptospiraceae bacterium]HQI18478.1 YaeQ family protein [Leptospiraceae bacterium]